MGHQALRFLAVGLLVAAVGCDASVELDDVPSAPATVAEDPPAAEAAPPRERVEGNKPVKQGNPSGGYLSAVAGGYRSAREKIEMLPIDQAIQHFWATEGRYPKSHEEFMEKVVKPLQMQLPEVEEGYELQYDPEDHAMWKVPIEVKAETSEAGE